MVMTALQLQRLRVGFNGRLEGAQTLMITMRIVIAAVIMAALARGIWALLDGVVGRSLGGELISVGLAIVLSIVAYGWMVLAMRIPEARQIERLVLSRLGRG
jgi:hypothetical protein